VTAPGDSWQPDGRGWTPRQILAAWQNRTVTPDDCDVTFDPAAGPLGGGRVDRASNGNGLDTLWIIKLRGRVAAVPIVVEPGPFGPGRIGCGYTTSHDRGNQTMSHSPVIVIGSGSAGLTAALYAARANLAPVVFEGKEPGGQLTLTTTVDNFPGFPEGIQGPELMDLMRKQAQRFGADTRWESVFAVDLKKRPFSVRTTDDPTGDPESGTVRDYTADGLIVATGASARWLGIEGTFKGEGVSTCATCDGHFYRGKEIAVVGGGDSAAEEATFLTRFANKVTLIHRRDALRASKIMQERLRGNPKIAYAWNSAVDELYGDTEPYKALKGVTLRSTTDGSLTALPIDGLFLAIGHTPNTAIFKGQLATTPDGYLLTRTALAWKDVEAPPGLLETMPNYGTATSVEGVFGAGDVVDTHYRQAITAAGSGCAAAMDCEKWLETVGASH
jgi:thioredoxin reductase (NADPH)